MVLSRKQEKCDSEQAHQVKPKNLTNKNISVFSKTLGVRWGRILRVMTDWPGKYSSYIFCAFSVNNIATFYLFRVIEERLHEVIRQNFQNAKQNNQGASEELLDNIKDELVYEIKVSRNSIKLNNQSQIHN